MPAHEENLVLDRPEAGQALDRVAEPDFRGRVEDGQQCTHRGRGEAWPRDGPTDRPAPTASAAVLPSKSATIRAHVGAAAAASAEGKSRVSSSAGYQAATDHEVRLRTKFPTSTIRSGRTAATRCGRGVGSPRLGLVEVTGAVPLSGRRRPCPASLQPEQAAGEDRRSPKGAGPGGGVGVGPEIAGGDQILDLRRARQCVHRERERTQSDRAGDEPLGDVGLAKQRRREGIYGEGDHEQRHAAVSQHAAGQHDGQDRPSRAQSASDHPGDRRRPHRWSPSACRRPLPAERAGRTNGCTRRRCP